MVTLGFGLAVLLGVIGVGITQAGAKPRGGGGTAPATTFSGRAVVVDATVAGMNILVSDTGQLPASGGALENSLLEFDQAGISGRVAHAATIGMGDRSRSEASVADTTIAAAGHTVTASFLSSRAIATCGATGATASGNSELANLVIDGQAITVTGQPNQEVTLPLGAGTVIINEQTTARKRNAAGITVNALHVILLNPLDGSTLADIIVASSHADVTCGNTLCSGGDFITGGGWITTPDRGTFGVAGGIKNGSFWGHLTYIDHGTGMKVKGTGVTGYSGTGTSRQITGTAEVNGVPGSTYIVNVTDNGEPGRADMFMIQLSPNGYTAAGTLTGGNIQLHQPCK
ncbi:MAG: choice-of-anchor P family protein [Chthoniobacterales bacterium]